MATNETDANAVLFESDAATEDLALAKAPVQQAEDEGWETVYVWYAMVYFFLLYTVGLYGGYLFLVSAKWTTVMFTIILNVVSLLGVTAGSHRLWSHRSYKAKWPLQLILMIFHTSALQYTVINWVRDHRMHHKYTDTNADPHNATRGLFWSHLAALFYEKHPAFERNVKKIDYSDVENNPLLQFQKKYYVVLVLLLCFILPTVIPVYFWNETWSNAFFVTTWFKLSYSYNCTGLVNSVAHKFGYKPYDKDMLATDMISFPYCLMVFGESYHNYHHAFPWDYKTSEFSGFVFNLTTTFIDSFAKIGWAYDLKTISDEIIQKRVERTGDGSHHLWGRCDKDLPKEEIDGESTLKIKKL